MEKNITALAQESGIRLDLFLQKHLEGVSRTKAHTLILEGQIKVNTLQKKPSYRIRENDAIQITLDDSRSEALAAYEYDIPVIYEDSEIIVINKPQGISVHPAHSGQCNTLVNALIFMGKTLSTINGLRPGIVHRLDKETSGVMLIAKTNRAHLDLVSQFRDRVIKKEYFAIVWGHVSKASQVVDLPMKRDEHQRLKMKISFINAKQAYTEIKLEQKLKEASLLLLYPKTGRMHQIRVHLKFLNLPIVGDKKYGIKDSYDSLFLHAHTIHFKHPSDGKALEFTAPMPERFEKFIRENSL